MKKNSIVLAALGVCLAGAASASDVGFKSGFRAGAGVGYKKYKVTQRANFSDATAFLAPESLSKMKRKGDSSFSIHGGYDHFFGNLYSALELDYRYSPGKNTLTLQPIDPLYVANPIKFTQTHKHDVGLSGHLGYKVTSEFIGYGIVNIRWGKFEETVRRTSTAVNNNIADGRKKQTRMSFGGGFGAKYLLPCNWSIAAEATFNTYKSMKIQQNLHKTADLSFFVRASKPKITNVIVKVSKTF